MARPISTTKNEIDIVDEINSSITKLENGCWEWSGLYIGAYPYIFCFGSKNRVVKFLWGLATGQKYPFRTVAMECRNNRCVNPAHVKINEDQVFKAKKEKLFLIGDI